MSLCRELIETGTAYFDGVGLRSDALDAGGNDMSFDIVRTELPSRLVVVEVAEVEDRRSAPATSPAGEHPLRQRTRNEKLVPVLVEDELASLLVLGLRQQGFACRDQERVSDVGRLGVPELAVRCGSEVVSHRYGFICVPAGTGISRCPFTSTSRAVTKEAQTRRIWAARTAAFLPFASSPVELVPF